MLLLLGLKRTCIMYKKLDYIRHIFQKSKHSILFFYIKTPVEAACSGALAKKNFAYKIA